MLVRHSKETPHNYQSHVDTNGNITGFHFLFVIDMSTEIDMLGVCLLLLSILFLIGIDITLTIRCQKGEILIAVKILKFTLVEICLL